MFPFKNIIGYSFLALGSVGIIGNVMFYKVHFPFMYPKNGVIYFASSYKAVSPQRILTFMYYFH